MLQLQVNIFHISLHNANQLPVVTVIWSLMSASALKASVALLIISVDVLFKKQKQSKHVWTPIVFKHERCFQIQKHKKRKKGLLWFVFSCVLYAD